MARDYSLLTQLEPINALRILAAFVKNENHQVLLSTLRVETLPKGTGALTRYFSSLGFPVPQDDGDWPAFGQRLSKADHGAALHALGALYKQLIRQEPTFAYSQRELPSRDDVISGLANLLMVAVPADGRPAQPTGDEYLLVVTDSTRNDAIHDVVVRHTTAVRWTSFRPNHSEAAPPNGDYILYYIKSSRDRNSDIRVEYRSGQLEGAILLDLYRAGDDNPPQLIGLPPDMKVDAEALKHFATLLRCWPKMFVGEAEPVEAPVVLAAYVPDSTASRHMLLYLGSQRFINTGANRHWEYVNMLAVGAHPLPMEELERRLHNARPEIRFRLELQYARPTPREALEVEIAALRQKQLRIERRLAELQAFHQSRPTLLCFSHEQLPVMADIIRSYRLEEVKRIKYLFFSTIDESPEGLHFLLVPPDVDLQELDPLLYWTAFAEYRNQPMRYWVDPDWSKHYYDNSSAIVFTPYGSRLSPSLHSWSAAPIDPVAGATMDDYLRDIFKERYRGKFGAQTLPAQPIYVFGGEVGRGQRLTLTLLDRAAFQPLLTRLRWLNDNLRVLHLHAATEQQIDRIAAADHRSALMELVSRRAGQIHEQFEQTALGVNDRLAEVTQQLTNATTRQFSNVSERANNFLEKARQLNERLAGIEAEYERLVVSVKQTEQELQNVRRQAEEALGQHYDKQESKIDKLIRQAENRRTTLETRVKDQIEGIQKTEAQLRETIARLHADINNDE